MGEDGGRVMVELQEERMVCMGGSGDWKLVD
jgi:hypothetical protein